MNSSLINSYLTEKGYVPCIPWYQCEFIMGKKKYKQFVKWMNGQTVPTGGVYGGDLERFLKGLPVID